MNLREFKSSIFVKGVLMMLGPVLLGFAVCISMLYFLASSEEEIKEEGRYLQVLDRLGQIAENTIEATSASDTMRSVYSSSEEQKASEKKLLKAIETYKEPLNKLLQLCSGSPKESAYAEKLVESCNAGIAHLLKSTSDRKQLEEIYTLQEHTGKRAFRANRDLVLVIENETRKAGEKRSAQERNVVCALFASLFVLGGLIYLSIFSLGRGVVERARVLNENVGRFSRQEDLLPALEDSDELFDLDRAFRSMSQQLTEAKQKEREYFLVVTEGIRDPLLQMESGLKKLESLSKNGPAKLSKTYGNLEKGLKQLKSLQGALEDAKDMQSDNIELDLTEMLAGSLAEEAIWTVDPFASKCGVCLKYDYEPGAAKTTVELDRFRLLRALVNLLTNAAKFSPAGSEVWLRLSKQEGSLLFEVIDSGPGIEQEKIDLLFGAYSQLNKSDEAKAKGFGLGLAICKRIAEAHGGILTVQSEPGKGSCFSIRLAADKEQTESKTIAAD